MKTVLALATAAFLCSTAGAMAGGTKVYDIKLDGTCDIYHISVKGVVAVAQDTPSCTGTYGMGLISSVKGFGKNIALALQDQSGSPGEQYVLELSYPVTASGTFTLYQTRNGVNYTDALDGTYTLDDKPGQAPKDGKPFTSLLAH